jgi:hypothetical protein
MRSTMARHSVVQHVVSASILKFAVCNTVTSGPGDTYDLSIPYTGMEGGTAVVNNGASGRSVGMTLLSLRTARS